MFVVCAIIKFMLLLLEPFFEGDIFDGRPLLGEQSGAWVVVRILKPDVVEVGGLSAPSLPLSDSSSVGMGGISCLCGLVL